MKQKILSFFISYKKYILTSFLVSTIGLFVLGASVFLVHASFGSWGDTSLIHACKNSRGGITLVASTDSCNTNETQVTWLKDVDAGTGLSITRSSSGATLSLASTTNDGWTAAGETWTYASADSPTFTFTVSGDDTGKYSPGMRINLTQTSAKYFIITNVSYSSPNTTVTVYGGTDYTLANASITNPYYSMEKAPVGFPLDPTKWTVEVTDSTTRYQSPDTHPVQNTWYNIGSVSINVPIGSWHVSYNVNATADGLNIGRLNAFVTLSTANNSESDSDFTTMVQDANLDTNSVTQWISSNLTREKVLNLSSKNTYYLNTKTDLSGIDTIYNNNGTSKLIIRAICAYL